MMIFDYWLVTMDVTIRIQDTSSSSPYTNFVVTVRTSVKCVCVGGGGVLVQSSLALM
jgi:hypothetical protein